MLRNSWLDAHVSPDPTISNVAPTFGTGNKIFLSMSEACDAYPRLNFS
jgi:hypothetical protein